MKVELTNFLGSEHHSNGIFSIALSHSKKQLITACHGGNFQLWNVKTKDLIRTFESQVDSMVFGATSLVQFSLDDQYAITGSLDHKVKVYSAKDGKEICTFKGHTDTVYCVDLSSDNRYAVAASQDHTCKLWDLARELQIGGNASKDNEIECIRTFKGHTAGVKAVAFTRDVKQIVSGSYDKTLKLWCVETGKELRTFTGHSQGVICLSLSLDDKYVVSGSLDKSAVLWNLETGKQLKTFKGHHDHVYDASISSDNNFVITASYDSSVLIWDCKTAINTHTLTGHTGGVRSLALSSDDMTLFTGSDGKCIKMLDLSCVPNIPGMAWQLIGPFVMLRYLMEKNRAVTTLPSLRSRNNDDKEDQVVSDNIEKNKSYMQKQDQVLQTIMAIDADDMFHLSLSFLISG